MGAVWLLRSRVRDFPSTLSSMVPDMGLPLQGWYFILSGSRPALARSLVSTP